MKNLILALTIFFSSFGFAQSQFEQGMGKAFSVWQEGKNSEATAMFERIASAEKNSWLPNYYVALINTTAAFDEKDKEKVSALLSKAQNSLDIELAKAPENPELLVLQALIYTAWISFDPMTNGMTMSGKVMEIYGRAIKIAPENPRVVFGKAEFEIGGAKFFGTDIKPLCAEVDRSIALFEKFKPENAFSPKWGLDRAIEAQKECKK